MAQKRKKATKKSKAVKRTGTTRPKSKSGKYTDMRKYVAHLAEAKNQLSKKDLDSKVRAEFPSSSWASKHSFFNNLYKEYRVDAKLSWQDEKKKEKKEKKAPKKKARKGSKKG